MSPPKAILYPTSYLRWNVGVLEQWWSPLSMGGTPDTTPEQPHGEHGTGEWRVVPKDPPQLAP